MSLRFLLLFALASCLLLDASQEVWAKRSAYRRYRALRKEIRSKYRFSVRKRYSKPCRAQRRLEGYLSWVGRFLDALPQRSLSRRYKRYLRYRARYFRKVARRQLRYATRRCRRYWKKELKRNGSKKLRRKCRNLQAAKGSGAPLWIAVRPWAHVYLNGTLCATAPLMVELQPGRYKVRLSFPPGRDNYAISLQLTASRKPTLMIRTMRTAPPPARRFANVLSPQQLKFVLKRHRSDFQGCRLYQPGISKVVLSWKVSPSGKPHTIQWVSPPGVRSRFRKCILRAAARMRFPKIKGMARIHAYPISLK